MSDESKKTQETKESKISDFIQKLISAGWGIITLSEEKTKNFIDEMVHKGEISRKEGEGLLKNIIEKVQAGAKEKEQKIMETVHKYMKTCPATKNEIESLNARIKELEKKLADIETKEQRKKPEKQS